MPFITDNVTSVATVPSTSCHSIDGESCNLCHTSCPTYPTYTSPPFVSIPYSFPQTTLSSTAKPRNRPLVSLYYILMYPVCAIMENMHLPPSSPLLCSSPSVIHRVARFFHTPWHHTPHSTSNIAPNRNRDCKVEQLYPQSAYSGRISPPAPSAGSLVQGVRIQAVGPL